MNESEIDLSALTKAQQDVEVAKYWFKLEQSDADIWFNTGPL